jgi:hypothetical protein
MAFKVGSTPPPDPSGNNNPSKEIWVDPYTGGYLRATSSPIEDQPNTPPQLTTSTTSTTTINPASHSILPASGFYSSFQIAMQSGAFPELLSSAKWSDNAQGFPQQTFLGASIRSFTMQGGFGDSSSSLTVDLVVDEYNPSDKTPIGKGDDVYHSGGSLTQPDIFLKHPTLVKNPKFLGDNFVPPIPGSPVFFKFGPNFATVEEAYRKTFDDLYNYNTIGDVEETRSSGPSIDQVITGQYNLLANNYVDLSLVDALDGGVIRQDTDPRGLVDYNAVRNNPLTRGKDHIVFGGILQTYVQSRTTGGNPLYTVNVIDPREILSNVILILNNYAGPTYEQKNVLNLYGLLEYNATDATKNTLGDANELKKIVQTIEEENKPLGSISFKGDDKYYKNGLPNIAVLDAIKDRIKTITNNINTIKRIISQFRKSGNNVGADAQYNQLLIESDLLKQEKIKLEVEKAKTRPFFPMTGTGFSRRSSQGIPYYRVKDAINALMEYYMPLPLEYKDQGFGGKINFRGFNYVVDFGGLPELPEFYFLDFDQINMLELALEICDITNKDMFVSLLPVIDHPACSVLRTHNAAAADEDIITGIIRIDTIDRSEQPIYGAVKKYIDSLALNKIYVENQDLGYELSNITTDKFIVGAQEIDMHYFSTNADRDILAFKKTGKNGVFPNKSLGYEWTLEASLEQQVLPYYGKLGNNAVTIPKGFGAYQQILLDSSSLNAAGVGAYYVATEMELRCALISFERWKDFLKTYNDTYMDSTESDDAADRTFTGLTAAPIGANPPVIGISSNYVVSVPRSVFDTYALPINNSVYGSDGLPLSACNPPYGYPLYYKRMTRIGIPEGGLTDLYQRWVTLTTNLAELQSANRQSVSAALNSQFQNYQQISQSQPLTAFEQQYFNTISTALNSPNPSGAIDQTIGTLENIVRGQGRNVFAILPSIAKKNNKNALKVYNFVKSVAEECLGKKFLIKIPREVNLFYDNKIDWNDPTTQEYKQGPFGFRPRSTKNIAGYEFTPEFKQEVTRAQTSKPPAINMMQSFLSPDIKSGPNPTTFIGALRINYNPMTEKYESNYTPTNIGGYFPFDLYQNTLGVSATKDIAKANFNALPPGVIQGLVPQDLTNFINEDGRVSPYVRFDNAEDLTLEGLNDADFTQQFIVGNAMIPDLTEALENTGPDEFHTFPNFDNEQNDNQAPKPKQIAFVKCSVDENLYLPPRFLVRKVQVHGQQVKDIGTKSIPKKIFIPCSGVEGTGLVAGTGVWLDSFSFYKANFVPLPIAGTQHDVLDFERFNPYINIPGGSQVNNSEYVNTDLDKLNTEHVYAIITLPSRISPNKDARHRNSNFQNVDAEKFQHLMTMDTVRGLPGFALPTPPKPNVQKYSSLPRGLNQATDNDNKIKAWFAMKKNLQHLSFALPQSINVTVPSPVYPDLIALPLMSNDRCYGPWISSQLDEQAYLLKNIGGRVDFIKDENLSPWNYGGYDLMNDAGRLQAEFSNSLLLFSERGSFTIPDLPKGNSLCQALTIGGPLVTSINIDVSTGGAKTTYQMDLYTASFGKLQKQKQEEISKISRERKKLQSERNALIRKGLGKNQSARNFANEYSMLSRGIMPGLNELGLGMANAYTRLVASVSRNESQRWSSGAGGNGLVLNTEENSSSVSMQSTNMMGEAAQNFPDQFSLAKNYQDTGGVDLDQWLSPASHGYHANMPFRPNSNISAHNSLYFVDNDGGIELDNGSNLYGGNV